MRPNFAAACGDVDAVVVLGDVALREHRLGAGRAHRFGCGFRFGCAAGVVDDHRLGAARGRADRERRAQTRRGAGDENDFAVEIAHGRAP